MNYKDNYPVDVYKLPVNERVLLWLMYGERGISSDTICYTLSGIDRPDFFEYKSFSNSKCPPSDSSDFRRCYLLLKLIPEFKTRLSEVAEKYPNWKKYVEKWDILTALYEYGVNEDGISEILSKYMREDF